MIHIMPINLLGSSCTSYTRMRACPFPHGYLHAVPRVQCFPKVVICFLHDLQISSTYFSGKEKNRDKNVRVVNMTKIELTSTVPPMVVGLTVREAPVLGRDPTP